MREIQTMAEYGLRPMLDFTSLPPRIETRKRRRKRAVKTPTNPRVKTVTLSQAPRSQGCHEDTGAAVGVSELSLKWVSPQFHPSSQPSTLAFCSDFPARVPCGQQGLNLVPLEVRGGGRLPVNGKRNRTKARRVRGRRAPLHELEDNSLEEFETPKISKYRKNVHTSSSQPPRRVSGDPAWNAQCPKENYNVACGSANIPHPTETNPTSNASVKPSSSNLQKAAAASNKRGILQVEHNRSNCPPKTITASKVPQDPHGELQMRSSMTTSKALQDPDETPPLHRSASAGDISHMLSDTSLDGAPSTAVPTSSEHHSKSDPPTTSPKTAVEVQKSRDVHVGAHSLTSLEITTFNPHAASTPVALRRTRPNLETPVDAGEELRDLGGSRGSPFQPYDSYPAVSFKTPVWRRSRWRLGSETDIPPNLPESHRGSPKHGSSTTGLEFKRPITAQKGSPLRQNTSPEDVTLVSPSQPRTSHLPRTPGATLASEPGSCADSSVQKNYSVLAVETPQHLWGVPVYRWRQRRPEGAHPAIEDTFG